jgi:hypothetical protein
MKSISFVGRVVELYGDLPWSSYGRAVPEGHDPGEKPVRINVEVAGALELAAVIPPDAAKGIEVGAVVRVSLASATEAELTTE